MPLPLPLPLLFDTILLDGVSNRNTYLHIHMYLHTINGRHVDLHTVRERIHMHTYKQVKIIHTHSSNPYTQYIRTYMCTCRVCVCAHRYHPTCPKPPPSPPLPHFRSLHGLPQQSRPLTPLSLTAVDHREGHVNRGSSS